MTSSACRQAAGSAWPALRACSAAASWAASRRPARRCGPMPVVPTSATSSRRSFLLPPSALRLRLRSLCRSERIVGRAAGGGSRSPQPVVGGRRRPPGGRPPSATAGDRLGRSDVRLLGLPRRRGPGTGRRLDGGSVAEGALGRQAGAAGRGGRAEADAAGDEWPTPGCNWPRPPKSPWPTTTRRCGRRKSIAPRPRCSLSSARSPRASTKWPRPPSRTCSRPTSTWPTWRPPCRDSSATAAWPWRGSIRCFIVGRTIPCRRRRPG